MDRYEEEQIKQFKRATYVGSLVYTDSIRSLCEELEETIDDDSSISAELERLGL
jgi:hypothetical protein